MATRYRVQHFAGLPEEVGASIETWLADQPRLLLRPSGGPLYLQMIHHMQDGILSVLVIAAVDNSHLRPGA